MPHYKNQNNQIYFLDSEEYEHLLPPGCVPITDAESESIRLAAIIPPTYAELRAAEYPPITDFADAYYWSIKGDSSKMQAYIDACLAVKAKYSK